jgi:hypothetical protein
MLAALLGAVRADIDRQAGWARAEARGQIRYALLIAAMAGMAVLAGLGVMTVGLIAFHSWLAPQVGSLGALGIIGAGLLVLMLCLVLVVFYLPRPSLKTRPALQVVKPAALLRAGTRLSAKGAGADIEESLRFATDTVREGSRSNVLGALALIAIAGVIAGRRLRLDE